MPRDPHLRLTSGLTRTCPWLSSQLTLWMVCSDPCPHFLCCSMISFCPVCGKGVKGSFKFCPFCGNSLPVEEHAEAQTGLTPPVSSFQGRSQQSPAPSCSFLQSLQFVPSCWNSCLRTCQRWSLGIRTTRWGFLLQLSMFAGAEEAVGALFL